MQLTMQAASIQLHHSASRWSNAMYKHGHVQVGGGDDAYLGSTVGLKLDSVDANELQGCWQRVHRHVAMWLALA